VHLARRNADDAAPPAPPALLVDPSNLLMRQPFTSTPLSSTTAPAASEMTTGPNKGRSLRGWDFTSLSGGEKRNKRAKYRKGREPSKIPFLI